MTAVNFGKPDVRLGSVFAEINYIFQDSSISVFPPALFLVRPLPPFGWMLLGGRSCCALLPWVVP